MRFSASGDGWKVAFLFGTSITCLAGAWLWHVNVGGESFWTFILVAMGRIALVITAIVLGVMAILSLINQM